VEEALLTAAQMMFMKIFKVGPEKWVGDDMGPKCLSIFLETGW
jgi:hypothetical protein